MKRKNEKVPEFDEIIFENRNKEYGAYDLRKHYNATASISILGGVALCALLLLLFSFSGEKVKADPGPISVVIQMDQAIKPDPVKPEEKAPAALTAAIKNLAPVVTNDSLNNITMPLTNDDLVDQTKNGNVNDTLAYVSKGDEITPPEPEPFYIVEEMPSFPGGVDELMKYIGENISYPQEAINNNIQGRVILKFAINTDGSVDRIQVLRGIDPSLDTEALRVIKTLPKFKPGKQNGVPVPVWFTIPVMFKLESN